MAASSLGRRGAPARPPTPAPASDSIVGAREGEARRPREAASGRVPPRGAPAAASGSGAGGAGSRGRRGGDRWPQWAAGPGARLGAPEVGSAGLPGSELSPSTGPSLGTSPLLDWFSAQSSAPARSRSPVNSKGPRRAASARESVAPTQTAHHSATRPGPRWLGEDEGPGRAFAQDLLKNE